VNGALVHEGSVASADTTIGVQTHLGLSTSVDKTTGVSVGWAIGVSVGWAIGVSVGWAIGVSVGWAIGVSVGWVLREPELLELASEFPVDGVEGLEAESESEVELVSKATSTTPLPSLKTR
jgi:hypothetical protein